MADDYIYKIVDNNKKAKYEYEVESTLEAGIILKGTEVKSIRMNRASITEAYAEIRDGEVFLDGMHVSPYKKGNIYNVDPTRKRKLLLRKKEIEKLDKMVQQKGYTLVPLRLYITNSGLVKVELALAKGKKLYDKRETLAKKDAQRRMKRHMSPKNDY